MVCPNFITQNFPGLVCKHLDWLFSYEQITIRDVIDTKNFIKSTQ
ncbi:hypothetical protein LMANV2_60051 [Leptospira interrogans serovar Manilae]|uniref:Uncharacterized protein n=1 Tax=Leptospira interrogans serovar Manilae TaxID=214675 RepID=A0AAQ1P278_LEPIR|nr:hypothetical protein LMANV2_60051 [Leptospira interrogans serovar Manilae]